MHFMWVIITQNFVFYPKPFPSNLAFMRNFNLHHLVGQLQQTQQELRDDKKDLGQPLPTPSDIAICFNPTTTDI